MIREPRGERADRVCEEGREGARAMLLEDPTFGEERKVGGEVLPEDDEAEREREGVKAAGQVRCWAKDVELS